MNVIQFNETKNIISFSQAHNKMSQKDKLRVKMLKTIANGLNSSNDIENLNRLIAEYYYKLAQAEADIVWKEKEYSQADIENWLNID